MKKLAVITTHPIQYNSPFFKLLAGRGKVRLKVFYTWSQAIEGFEDPDFGTKVKWDIPLLDGYDWEAVDNISKNPSSKTWEGIHCPDLIDRVKAFVPDVVMVYGWNLKSHFRIMKFFKGKVPVWFFGDSTLLDEKPGWRKLARRIWLRWVYRHIDKAFYVGTNNKAYFLEHGLKENQLMFFPHAVENDRFFDDEERQLKQLATEWREKLGHTPDDIIILFVGKFESKKSPDFLIHAVQQYNAGREAPVKLLMVGNGHLEDKLKKITDGDPYIQFIPFQNQSIMPLVYRLGDIFCLPSQGPGETWGLAVNEAMACGRPVLVSDKVGCWTDLVYEIKNGVIFRAGDSVSFQGALKRILKKDLKEMGKASQIVIQKWNYKSKCEVIENQING